jgi:hypothetical protein
MSIERIERDIRIKDWLHNMDPDVREMMQQDEYNPKLYLPNKDWKPPVASLRVESAIRSFSQQIIAKQHEYQQIKGNRNLTQLHARPSALSLITTRSSLLKPIKIWASQFGIVKITSSKLFQSILTTPKFMKMSPPEHCKPKSSNYPVSNLVCRITGVLVPLYTDLKTNT